MADVIKHIAQMSKEERDRLLAGIMQVCYQLDQEAASADPIEIKRADLNEMRSHWRDALGLKRDLEERLTDLQHGMKWTNAEEFSEMILHPCSALLAKVDDFIEKEAIELDIEENALTIERTTPDGKAPRDRDICAFIAT